MRCNLANKSANHFVDYIVRQSLGLNRTLYGEHLLKFYLLATHGIVQQWEFTTIGCKLNSININSSGSGRLAGRTLLNENSQD